MRWRLMRMRMWMLLRKLIVVADRGIDAAAAAAAVATAGWGGAAAAVEMSSIEHCLVRLDVWSLDETPC